MFENGIDGELERGKGTSSHQFSQNDVVYAPATPAKPGQPDPSMIFKTWLENPFDEALFEETSVKKTFNYWNGNFGSTSQSYEAWNDISCTDLLAMANAAGGGAAAAGQTQPYGGINFCYDLNSPPLAMGEPPVNTGLSLQFTPLTPDPNKSMNLAADKDVVESNKDSEKGLREQTNVNETPQPKQKRRKHRPKVVTEGKPKRARKPATPKPATPNGSTAGKRKYVRRTPIEKSSTPAVDEKSGGVNPSPDQRTKKTCKRKIDFNESEKQAEVTVDKTCTVTSEVVENYRKVHETVSPSPITPSKMEQPAERVKRKYTQAKCKIDFLQETHDKLPSQLPSLNKLGCNKEDEAQRSIDEIKLLNEHNEHNVGMFRDSLESFLSIYTDFNSNVQSSTIDYYKGKAPEMPIDGYKKKKITMHDSITFGGYQQQHTYMESNVASIRVGKKKTKKQAMVASFYHSHLGYNPRFEIDALTRQFEQLHINRDSNALVVYQHGGSLVPYNMFNPIKKKKLRPKVDLDDETNRVWMLLLEDINSKGVDGTDEDKAKWWEEERRVFRGRADSFIARMHLVQGDRRFSQWKGSVLDSVVGVFLTQNVSDHLSSSAFMSLAARFPLKPNTGSELVNEEVVNSNEFSKSCIISVDLNEKSECEVVESFEKVTNHVEIEIASSQNSADTCCIHNCEESIRVYEKCGSEESGISIESVSQTMGHVVNTISSQESANSHCCMVQQDLEKINLSTESSKESVQKVVDFHSQKIIGVDEGSSKVTKEKTGKSKIKVDWNKLFEGEVKQKRERTPNRMNSMDYEAIRAASVNDVADAIKERGMHYRLAERIKDMLDRLVRDHGSTDLEWLRDIPPDKAKEYLLSFTGLGLKSVECIRLLTLHHLAFPVDTNVGRIAVRLGWVPLQALPESLQLHLLELYPIQETIQKYLWPRLCKLDQKTLYELHYQMITFGKVFCTKTKPNCNACPMRGECRHFASAFASARLALPAPEGSIAGSAENKTCQNPIKMIDLPSTSEQPKQPSEDPNCNPIIEEPATPVPIIEVPATPGPIIEVPATQEPIVEMPASPEPEQIQQETFDIEDFNGDDDEEIPMIKLNIEEFTQNLQTYMERHMELGEVDLSKALVALTPEAASIPTPKLKNVNQLRTEHQVYELPDSHPLLEGLDKRETDDPCPYLLAIWTPGETADSIQPPEGQCCFQESGTMCNQETCFFCISTREANAQTIRGTLLIPCRTANRGSFPLNGTYFQVNEVFADHESSLNPIDVPRAWLWNLPKRTVYFGTSVPSIFKGLTTEQTQICFWRGFVCVRGFDRKERTPRPLRARLHFPASRLKQQSKPKTDQNEKLKQ